MATVALDATTVKYGSGATLQTGVTAGEIIDRGEPVYKKAADKKYWLASSTDTATADVKGIAVTPAAAEGVFTILTRGPLMGTFTTLTVGQHVELSSTAGGLADGGDRDTAGSGIITGLGIATATDTLEVMINATGATVT